MNRITSAILAIVGLAVAGCDLAGIRGNGHIVTDSRPVSAFTELTANGAFQIEWRSGAPALSITTDENLLRYINNSITGNQLRLHSARNLRPTHGIKVVISSPARSGARLTGATRATISQLSGSKFAIESTGAANVTVDGNIEQLMADMTGASKLNAHSLQAKAVEISTTGAGYADVTVSDTLKVSITGAGKVTYSGNPPTIEKQVSGAGSIRQKE
jgi:putative autotransporter adhesin-like protein